MIIIIIVLLQVDVVVLVLGNWFGVVYIDLNMKLVIGIFCLVSEDWFEELLECGLCLIFVQSGQLCCWIFGQFEYFIEGLSLCIIVNDGDFILVQIYGIDKLLCYIIVQFGVEVLDSCFGWLFE